MEKIKLLIKDAVIISGIVFFIVHMFTQITQYHTKQVEKNRQITPKPNEINSIDIINNEHIWENTEFMN